MHQRCENERNHAYLYYGGRGICVCEEWKDYTVFREWALSHGYSESLIIDRINNDGNYCTGKLQLATMKEQSNNRRKRNSVIKSH